jgi:hypothetical protein
MPRTLRIVALITAGLLAARVLVLAIDGIAEALERRPLKY